MNPKISQRKNITIFAGLFLIAGMVLIQSSPSFSTVEAGTQAIAVNSGYTGTADGGTAWSTSSSQTATYGSKTLLQTLNGDGVSVVGSIVSTAKVYPAGSTGAGTTGKLKIGSGTALGWDLTFTLANAVTATAAVLDVKQYGTDTGVTISVNSSTAQTVVTGTLSFSFTASNTISIKPGAGTRFYLLGISLTTAEGSIKVTSMALNKSTTTVSIGSTETLSVTEVLPADATDKTYTWSSLQSSIASVNSSGLVTGVTAGSATIKATANDGSLVFATCTVTVPPLLVSGVVLNKDSTMILRTSSETLIATVSPSNATNKIVNWTSTNTGVATVNSSGLVSPVSNGLTTIRATASDGSGFYDECNVTIISLDSLTITTAPTKTSYYSGESFSSTGLVIRATFSDSSTNENYVNFTYSPNGVLTISNSIITFTSSDDPTKTITQSISVVERTLVSISLNTSGTKTSFKLGEVFSTSGLVVNATYNMGPTAVVTFDSVSTPNMLTLGSQEITITYQTKTANYSISVTNNGAIIGATDLFISEYIEGSGNNKAIEIFNGTLSSKNLTNYKLKLYVNGSSSAGADITLGTGDVLSNSVYVIRYSSATNATIIAEADSSSASLNFNGNDAVGLFKSGVEIDRVGIIATENFGLDTTLVRKSTVYLPTTTYTASDWTSSAVDTVSNLGTHSFSGGVTLAQQAESYANFFLAKTQNKAGVCGSIDWSLLSLEYGYMASQTKDYFYLNTGANENVALAISRYKVIRASVPSFSDNFMVNGSGTPLPVNLDSLIIESNNRKIEFLYIIVVLIFIPFAAIIYSKFNRKVII